MNIYLIRHGNAERAIIGTKDFDRKLTEKGILEIELAATNWKILIDKFDIIYSSPYSRAKETAEIIKKIFDEKVKLHLDKSLSPGCSTENIIELANISEGQDIAFVGHQPDLSDHLANLISTSYSYSEFKTGTIAKISFDRKVIRGTGTLEFLIPPKLFK